MSVLDDIANGLSSAGAGDAVVEIETAFTPVITIRPLEPSSGPPGLLVRLLKPKVTIRAGPLVQAVAPGGEPARGPGLVLLGALVCGAGYLLWRATR